MDKRLRAPGELDEPGEPGVGDPPKQVLQVPQLGVLVDLFQ